jgi:hypothetical protein
VTAAGEASSSADLAGVNVATSRLAEEILPKIPFFGRLKDIGYGVAGTQVAVGIVSALYVLVTQATYFGKSFKYTWDHLDLLWHFHAVPYIGGWLVEYWKVFQHIFLRDAPESVLAYALVVMIFVKVRPLRDKTPFMDRLLVRLRMPSPYQGRLGRHADTSALQFLLLPFSMLLAAIPGEIASAVIFPGMALAHKYGYHSPWLEPASPWVPIAVGIVGGNFAGHKPAVKAGQDVQKFFLRQRLAVAYTAEQWLTGFENGELSLAEARDKLTSMRGTEPSVLYPDSYRWRYRSMLDKRLPAARKGKGETFAIVAFVLVSVVLAGYGLYVRKWGVAHGYWMP